MVAIAELIRQDEEAPCSARGGCLTEVEFLSRFNVEEVLSQGLVKESPTAEG
jgi:hypothetical protein